MTRCTPALLCSLLLTLNVIPAAVTAQSASPNQVAQSSAGQVGQRRTREQVATEERQPMGRIISRVRNRVDNRIHNRVDRYYGAQTDAVAAYHTAEAEAASRTPRIASRR